jgi:hypothetical protein
LPEAEPDENDSEHDDDNGPDEPSRLTQSLEHSGC